LLFSMKSLQYMIIKLMEDVDMGNLHPRLFEVFGQLQGQILSAVKHNAAYSITLEEGYKKVKNDHDSIEMQRSIEEQSGKIDSITGGDGPIKTRGTKGLIAGMHKQITEDADFEEISDKPRLTDAQNRPAGGPDMNKPIDPEDDFIVDDEMF